MVTKDEAVAAAAHFVKTGPYQEQADSVVMLPDTAVEFTYGWTVCFDLKEHIETGDFTKKPFSPVVVVPHDGTAAHMAPTFPATEQYMEMRASGDWPPTKGHSRAGA
ncbi:YrhB domain-containing protein [Streptomyces sp. NPDC017454]|uniref:YrhB domain-containing protein n=1 Tax=Streptomyces sp. NPDC017454 TaxID=3364997 RepID=UPI0037AFDE84